VTEVRKHRRQTKSGKTATVRQHHRNTGDGTAGRTERPQTFIFTVRSRSGKPINVLNGEPHDTISVYGREDLESRLRAAEQDPDIEVSYRDANSPPQALSLASAERPEPDFSWLDGDETPAGDFWDTEEATAHCSVCGGSGSSDPGNPCRGCGRVWPW